MSTTWRKKHAPPSLATAANRNTSNISTTCANTSAAADSLSYVEARAWFANGGDDSKIVKEKAAANAAKQLRDEESCKFMMAHPQYAVSAALLAQKPYDAYSYSTADFDRMYAALKDNPDTLHINFIKRNLDRFRKLGTGSVYTDFDTKTKEGSTVKLSSLIKPGKMTLVDFWASWCGPCRSAIPKVKAILEAHADDLAGHLMLHRREGGGMAQGRGRREDAVAATAHR